VTLKNGDRVEAGLVTGPDSVWSERIEELLNHKGETWRWGNEMALRHDLGIDALYYILHRDGEPFTNMMNIEYRGVGIFGHVFTKPDERQNGAAGVLMPLLMEDFRSRGGQALFLGTGYDTHPYHLYAKNGFVGLMPMDGTMAYYSDSEASFYQGYFSGRATVERLGWPHWSASVPLFTGEFDGIVRSHVMGNFGRASTEGPMIPMERDELSRKEDGKGARSAVLEIAETGAVAGFATSGRNNLWPGSQIVDLYCHPDYWEQGEDLLESIEIPSADRQLAYCDTGLEAKETILRAAGFTPVATYKNRVAVDVERTRFIDVTEWERAS
jgi:GNAT superfamily N-acetyltransferase